MKTITPQDIENQIIAVLQNRSDILQPFFEEYLEDFLFGKILEQSDSGDYMSCEELKKAIDESSD